MRNVSLDTACGPASPPCRDIPALLPHAHKLTEGCVLLEYCMKLAGMPMWTCL